MMSIGADSAFLITQADTARAAASIYTATLLATIPLAIALLVAFLLRDGRAESRALVWRCAIVSLLVIAIGRESPLHVLAWSLPSTLATPLVALGRVQVTSTAAFTRALGADASQGPGQAGVALASIVVIYLAGAALVLWPLIASMLRVERDVLRRSTAASHEWQLLVADVRERVRVRRRVRVVRSGDVHVPMTWGLFRPVIVLPETCDTWDAERRRMVLTHELAHVRSADWAFKLAARLVCAVYWFHPAAWWVAGGLRDDCERACDDHVLALGARRSDYAELLVSAAESIPAVVPTVALALSARTGLRARLASVLDARHNVRPIARGWATAAIMLTTLVAVPAGTVQLSPTRDVLTTLMRDPRWESRAYAVLGLARRPDSVAVARDAALLDPNPRVRAWARYALGLTPAPSDRPQASASRPR